MIVIVVKWLYLNHRLSLLISTCNESVTLAMVLPVASVVKDELRVGNATSGFPEELLPLGIHFLWARYGVT